MGIQDPEWTSRAGIPQEEGGMRGGKAGWKASAVACMAAHLSKNKIHVSITPSL